MEDWNSSANTKLKFVAVSHGWGDGAEILPTAPTNMKLASRQVGVTGTGCIAG
jgi:hypothetical protein